MVPATFRQASDLHGHPASTLTDNGMVYTTRFAGGRGGRTGLETELARRGIVQENSRPHHPTTCGKVGRFQPTRVVDAATGGLLRALTTDPSRDHQPTGRPPGPTRD